MTKLITNIYTDTGCEASPSCLTCPLPVCKYDVPGGVRQARRLQADAERIAVMEREGLMVAEAAERFGITERTMFRILERNRED